MWADNSSPEFGGDIGFALVSDPKNSHMGSSDAAISGNCKHLK
jgi:hypothetical protein